MSIRWASSKDKLRHVAIDRDSGFNFAIDKADGFHQVGFVLRVSGVIFGTDEKFDETFVFKTVGAAKAFVTRHFGF